MRSSQSNERGQALVLLVLAFVVLLGFTALAIDGGMVYADRRRAQNGADASALAGGAAASLYLENYYVDYTDFDCASSDPIIASKIANARAAAVTEAITRAAGNDYTIDGDISDNNGVATGCRMIDNITWVDKYIDVTTTLTADTSTSFAHFVYNGPVRNTVTAVSRLRPRAPFALGMAIVALREECQGNDGGVSFDGGVVVDVTGGGIFSNACMVNNGSIVNVTAGSLNCTQQPAGTECFTDNGGGSITPYPPLEGTEPLPRQSFYIPPPNCNAVPNRSYHNGDTEIYPGNYDDMRINAGRSVRMHPGLYCFDDPNNQGITVVGGGSLYVNPGEGVTIYIINGNFHVGGGGGAEAHVVLEAPPLNPNMWPPPGYNGGVCPYCLEAIPGVLIYLAEGNTGEVVLTGDSSSSYVGTVHAPDGTVEVGGGSLDHFESQIIGDTIKIHGNPSLTVNYLNDNVYNGPTYMELAR